MSKIVLLRPLCLTGAIALSVLICPLPAQAQEGLSIETFKYPSGPHALYDLVLPSQKQHAKWSVGGILFHSQEPVYRRFRSLDVVEDAYPVRYRVGLDLYGAVGILDAVELGLAIPIIVYQDGEGGTPGGDLQHAGVGDPRIEVKGQVLERDIFEMGLAGTLTVPLGHYASSGTDFMGARYPTFEPKVLAAFQLNEFLIAFNLGFLIRERNTIGSTDQTHALTWNAGVAYDFTDFDEPDGFRIALEANSEMGIDFDNAEIPIETALGIKYRTRDDIIFTMGGGPGLSRGFGTPMFRVFLAAAYDNVLRNCPAGPEDLDGFEDNDKCVDPDNDQDGILDVDDKCPNQPEDADGFKDEDGCPDEDNDNDLIPDAVDKCPMIPEDVDKFEDDDGCPEEGPGKATVKITDTQLLISSKIYFDYNKVTIKEVSYPILDAVAEALKATPHIKKVQIEGHTDNEGTEEYNQALSEERAKSVLTYLVGKGVSKERLTFKGYGFSRPKASNDTEEGKAINRRVEFTIISGEKP